MVHCTCRHLNHRMCNKNTSVNLMLCWVGFAASCITPELPLMILTGLYSIWTTLWSRDYSQSFPKLSKCEDAESLLLCSSFLAWLKIPACLPHWISSGSQQCGWYFLWQVLSLLTTKEKESKLIYQTIKTTPFSVVRMSNHTVSERVRKHVKESILSSMFHCWGVRVWGTWAPANRGKESRKFVRSDGLAMD